MIDLYFINKYISTRNEAFNKNKTNNLLCGILNLIILSISLYYYNDCNHIHSFEFVPAVLFPLLYIMYHTFSHQRCIKNNISINNTDINQQGGGIDTDTISSIGY